MAGRRPGVPRLPKRPQVPRLGPLAAGAAVPYLPKQPGYSKRVRAAAPQILAAVNAIAFNSDAFATGCWCSTRPRCPVASRGRPLAARRTPATPPTATAARTRAFSGAFCSSCSVRPTGCRAASTSRRPTSSSARRPPRSSSASRSKGHIVLADKGFAGREFEQLVTDLGGQPAPTARTKRRGLGRSAGCDSGWESYAGWGSSR